MQRKLVENVLRAFFVCYSENNRTASDSKKFDFLLCFVDFLPTQKNAPKLGALAHGGKGG